MTRLRCSSENEVASPVVPSTLSPSQPLSSRKRANAVERAVSGSPLLSIAVVMAAITPPSVLVVVMATSCALFLAAGPGAVDSQREALPGKPRSMHHDGGLGHAFVLDQF